jgi:hypothetical protein
MKYEYKTLDHQTYLLEEVLNKLAVEGWELICVSSWDDKNTFYFKREIKL